MKNKIDLKKCIVFSIIVTIIFLGLAFISNYFQYHYYNQNYNYAINNIIREIKEEYPDVSINKIIEIINQDAQDENNFLEEYGIDLDNDTVLLANNSQFRKYTIYNTIIVLSLSLILIFLLLRYDAKKDKKLKEITKYIEEINKRNYKLNILDNTEDELSILKNEVYKITVMLKEQAENEKRDKYNLKDSLSDISHQLKTPLTSITIMLNNILDDENMDIKTRNDFIKEIYREITNINFLVQALLKLSKFDANTITFVNKEYLIKDILDEAIKNVSMLCDLKNIEIVVHGNDIDKLECDFKWQVEALTNILKNCVEHSRNDSKVDISFEENKLYTKVIIKDNGVGIDKSDLPHIFERFYKGKNSSKESVGIGLALAKIIINKNNGNISVDSTVDVGTTFTIKYSK